MWDILPALLIIGLCVLLFRMLGRYIALPLVLAVVAGIIGAIFTEGNTWETIALVTGGITLLIAIIADFDNARGTLLGVLLGGGAGCLVLYLWEDVWAIVILLALALIGGLIGNAEAFEDMIGEGPVFGGSSGGGGSEPVEYRDALGKKCVQKPFLHCRECASYNNEEYDSCTYHHTNVSGDDYACGNFHML